MIKNVVAVFEKRMEGLKKIIPSTENDAREEIEFLTIYWKEAIAKEFTEGKEALLEKLGIIKRENTAIKEQISQNEKKKKKELVEMTGKIKELELKLKEKEVPWEARVEAVEELYQQLKQEMAEKEEKIKNEYREKEMLLIREKTFLEGEIERLRKAVRAGEDQLKLKEEEEKALRISMIEQEIRLGKHYRENLSFKDREIKTLKNSFACEEKEWKEYWNKERTSLEEKIKLKDEQIETLNDWLAKVTKGPEEQDQRNEKWKEEYWNKERASLEREIKLRDKQIKTLNDRLTKEINEWEEQDQRKEKRLEDLRKKLQLTEERLSVIRESNYYTKYKEEKRRAEILKKQTEGEKINIEKKIKNLYTEKIETTVNNFSLRLRNYIGIIGSAIQSYLDYSSGDELDDEIGKNLEISLQNIEEITKLINGFSDVISIPKTFFRPFSVAEILDKICLGIKEKCGEQKIELIMQYDKNLPQAKLDKVLIKEAFSKVVLNSFEAMPNGGSLTIAAALINTDSDTDKHGKKISDNQCQYPCVSVSFMDTGSGISEDVFGKIFLPFFTTKKGRTGLGLPKARQIIESHYGNITVESRKNLGTTATISLPIAKL